MTFISARPFPLYWRKYGSRTVSVFAPYSDEGQRMRAWARLKEMPHLRLHEFIEPPPIKKKGEA